MLKKITIKYIPQNNQDLARLIGTEYFKKLVKYMGGSSIYIPKEKNLTLKLRNQNIKQNFNGDIETLSRKYKITKTQRGGIVKHENLLNQYIYFMKNINNKITVTFM